MGLLIDGVWSQAWYDTAKTDGRFVRETSHFRNWITPDGTAGPTGTDGFAAESGRYHLYVSHACPWAHRTIIFRHIKQLAGHISVSVVHPLMLENGWSFDRMHNRQAIIYLTKISCMRSTRMATHRPVGGSRCPCYGTNRPSKLCQMNPLKLSVCSMRHLTN